MPDASLLTHRHVEVFRAVMTAGSVTGAAEALFTSQPTISRELSRMETLLRLVLFDRVRGRLQPTAQAYALFDEVQRSYAGLERVADTALRLRQFAAGSLSLACLPAFAHALLPGACARFQAAHAGVSVSVNPYESPLLEERLAAQAHDLGVTEHDGALAGAQASLLLELDEVAVLPEGHPLAAKRRLVAADFAGQAFVSFHPRDRYRQGVDRVFAEAGVDRQLAVETDNAVAVCAMVRHGLGLAIVNPLTALAQSAARVRDPVSRVRGASRAPARQRAGGAFRGGAGRGVRCHAPGGRARVGAAGQARGRRLNARTRDEAMDRRKP